MWHYAWIQHSLALLKGKLGPLSMQLVNILWGQNAEIQDIKAGVCRVTTVFEGFNIIVGWIQS